MWNGSDSIAFVNYSGMKMLYFLQKEDVKNSS